MKNCETCRWSGCKNYGKKANSCSKYIMSLEEENKLAKKVKQKQV